MSIINKIPHTARFISTSNRFTATFNVPIAGAYSFDVAANINQIVFDMQPNTVYLIERASFSCDIDEGIYLKSILTLPVYRLKKKISKEILYVKEYPLTNYLDDQEVVTWVQSDKGGDSITLSVSGVLDQVPETVGETTVIMNISFSVYAIEDKNYLMQHKDKIL